MSRGQHSHRSVHREQPRPTTRCETSTGASADWFSPPALAAPDPTAGVGYPARPAPAVAHPDEPPAWPGPDDEPDPFDTSVAELRYPELTPLAGWTWWWAGRCLVGYRGTDRGTTMLYVDDTEHAAVTRTTADG